MWSKYRKAFVITTVFEWTTFCQSLLHVASMCSWTDDVHVVRAMARAIFYDLKNLIQWLYSSQYTKRFIFSMLFSCFLVATCCSTKSASHAKTHLAIEFLIRCTCSLLKILHVTFTYSWIDGVHVVRATTGATVFLWLKKNLIKWLYVSEYTKNFVSMLCSFFFVVVAVQQKSTSHAKAHLAIEFLIKCTCTLKIFS